MPYFPARQRGTVKEAGAGQPMMDLKNQFYFSILSVGVSAGIVQWRRLTTADRFLAVLLGITLVGELLAWLAAYFWRSNMEIYHFFNPVQLLVLSLYFNYSVRVLRRLQLGWYLAGVGVVLELLNSCYLQPLTTDNMNGVLLNAVLVIIYCLFALYQVLMDEERAARQFALFWVSLALLLYWSITFTGWAMYPLPGPDKMAFLKVFLVLLAGTNYALYFQLALVFFFYQKLIPSSTEA